MPEILLLIPTEFLQLAAWPDPKDETVPLFINLPEDPLDNNMQFTVTAVNIQPERWDTTYNGMSQ